ncbi:His Kinase A (phospho-acceptor) domain-containing protein [Chitinophaga sp. YR573]|uniref:sensor histidine kinase n=1 Tax=Chitinophaga sp. YR573 TaxID=1881040 RepID=UPI0008C26CCF|nr:sensor histidine kinase [Chitinophaga sp. YR573]SEW13482.1 His Kinase A (phospho-acceptor) domain-containing protein [Chitinophaga sp. YR573]
MHIPVQKKVRLGFFIACTVVIAASICSYLVTKNLLDNAKWMNHTIEVSKRLEVITRQLKDAESAIRGYNITKDTSFLVPSMQERSIKIAEQYLILRRVTADNHQQQLHLDTLKSLLDNKYRQLMEGEQQETSLQKDTSAVQQGEKSMSKIERKVQDMMLIEEGHLHEKSELYDFFSAIWVPVIFISSLVAILIGIYSYITLTREFRLQLHIETRLKSYQRNLQQNILLLNKSNEELEQFAYVASHDLQEPLRKISTFSDRLQMKYGEQLPPEASQMLDRMVSAVSRMRVLINDLLLFSRAGRITPESITPVDMDALLQEVISDLEVSLQEHNASVTADPLPFIEGSATSFHQLFQNMLANAIKFAHPDRQLIINITSQVLKGKELENSINENRAEDSFCRIYIEDNGIGFDPVHTEKIFQLFQRLHGMSEYSGTGIGLAICKKIVDSHHGQIMAYGYPGKGATFVVILPLTQTQQNDSN